MTLASGEEIGEETHEGDQILFFVEGEGEAILEGESSPVRSGDYVFVPAGTLHNFVNTGGGPLRLLTTYAPEHPHGTVHRDEGRGGRRRRALARPHASDPAGYRVDARWFR